MRMYNQKKKIETSKTLLIVALVFCAIISAATIAAVFVIGDVTPLEFLIAGAFGLATTAYGFYYWKAKNENIKKYGGKNYADTCGE